VTPDRHNGVGPYFLALVPFAFLVMWFWSSGPGISTGDWAAYLLHARALAEGRPYGDTGYVFSALSPFLGPGLQPPALPLLLAAGFKLSGGYSPLMTRLIMVALSLPFLLLSGMYFGKRGSLQVGVVVTLFVSLAPGIPHWSLQVFTDLAFCSLAWGLILVLDRGGEFSRGRVVAVIALGTVMMASRLVGLVVIPTLLLFCASNYRVHRIRPIVPLVLWGGGAVAVVLGLGLIDAVFRQISPRLLDLGRIITRVKVLGATLIETTLYPTGVDLIDDVYHVVTLGLIMIGAVLWARTSWRSAAFSFAASYLGLLLVTSAFDGRYLWVVFPIVVYCMFVGAEAVLGRLAPGAGAVSRRRGITGVAVAIALASCIPILRAPKPASILDDPEFEGLVTFVSTEARSADVRIMFFRPRIWAWATRIPAMGLPQLRPDSRRSMAQIGEITMSAIRDQRLTHVVVGDLGLEPGPTEWLGQTIADHRCNFDVRYSNPKFTLYAFQSECAPPGETGAAGGFPDASG
jgi:hypothetical protein